MKKLLLTMGLLLISFGASAHYNQECISDSILLPINNSNSAQTFANRIVATGESGLITATPPLNTNSAAHAPETPALFFHAGSGAGVAADLVMDRVDLMKKFYPTHPPVAFFVFRNCIEE